jgi:hypothetical protein
MAREDLVAIYSDPDAADHALHLLHDEGVTAARVASPAPFPLIHHTGQPGAWRALGPIALVGGLTGFSCAAAFQVLSMKAMNLVVGGKPIVSWTAFGIIMFELTMLFAGVSNFSALVIMSAVARRRFSRKVRAQMTSERIVLLVPVDGCAEDRKKAIRACLSQALEVQS